MASLILQAKGKSQKQIASAALRDSVDAMRRNNPATAGTPPLRPGAGAPSRVAPLPANRGTAPAVQNRQFRLDPGPSRSAAGPSGGGGGGHAHAQARQGGGGAGALGRQPDARERDRFGGVARQGGLTGMKRPLGKHLTLNPLRKWHEMAPR
jgi:hypothetical protein